MRIVVEVRFARARRLSYSEGPQRAQSQPAVASGIVIRCTLAVPIAALTWFASPPVP